MRIRMNDEWMTLPEGSTLAQTLNQLKLCGDGVATVVNEDSVPRDRRASRVLNDGDRVEILLLAEGG